MKHCEVGTYEHCKTMLINGKKRGIDKCIYDIVDALNNFNIETVASCCGHGKMNGIISLKDGREIRIINNIRCECPDWDQEPTEGGICAGCGKPI